MMNNIPLTLQEKSVIELPDLQVEIQSHLGYFTDIDYFQVIIQNPEQENVEQLGLLRVGSLEGGLKRELQLREILGEHKMVAPLLSWMQATVDKVEHLSKETLDPSSEDILQSQDSDYLEDEFYEEKDIGSNQTGEKLFLLTELIDSSTTIKDWLTQEHSLDSSLLLTSQICQFFRQIHQQNWCIITLFPQFIQQGTPIQFFDLTGAYPVGEKLDAGFIGNYYPPEIAYGNPINEQMSSYLVGVLLYQALYQKLPPKFDGLTESVDTIDLEIKKVPRLYQILTLALSVSPEDRFSLEQLLNLLVETRRCLKRCKINWNIATHSTVGLAMNRLQNEDSYGIRQKMNSEADSLLLAVIADGMGGMAQGELASQLAVKTILESPILTNLTNDNQREEWIIDLVKKANHVISETVPHGGTTMSLVTAIGNQLSIAHVGDSRIFLIRNGEIFQLTEDHSLVAMLLASGQITEEESLNHPDRSVLTRSLGSKPQLSDGYIQTINQFNSQISLILEDQDILLLCSDGVWDLIASDELCSMFNNTQDLQEAVDKIIEQVLEKGANDNATLLALQCHLKNCSF